MYDALIMAIRAEIAEPAELVYAKVTDVSTSAERQKAHAFQRRDDLGPPGGACQRAEYRPAPQSRHRTPDHQRLPLDLDRVRPRAGRPHGLRFSGTDLFFGTAERPHPLSHAVSGRQARCGPICSPIARPTIPGCARCGRSRSRRMNAALPRLAPDHRRIRTSPATSISGRPISMSDRLSPGAASSWLATPLRPPALSPAPAPTRCSPTSANSVTSISPPGLPAKA